MDWNGYNDHLNNLMIKMLTTSEYSDVTLVCDDSDYQFKTHKSILSACSPELEKMIRETTEKNPVIYLKGIHAKEMESLLDFMYLGKVTVNQEDFQEWISAAANLKIISRIDNFDIEENTVNVTDEEIIIENNSDQTEDEQVREPRAEKNKEETVYKITSEGFIVKDNENQKDDQGRDQCSMCGKWCPESEMDHENRNLCKRCRKA